MTISQLQEQKRKHEERVKQFQTAREKFLQSTSIFRKGLATVYGTNRPDWHIDNSTERA